MAKKKKNLRGAPVALAAATASVRIDAVGCNGGAPSAAAFCVNGHVNGIGAGGNNYSVSFEVVNANPTDPVYDCTRSTPVDLSTNPPTWSFGPGALVQLAAAEDVTLTATLCQDGKPVVDAGTDTREFILNP
jgi:hypothetical protein